MLFGLLALQGIEAPTQLQIQSSSSPREATGLSRAWDTPGRGRGAAQSHSLCWAPAITHGFNQSSGSQTVLSQRGHPNSLSEGLTWGCGGGVKAGWARLQLLAWAGPAVSSAVPPSQLEKGCVSCSGISTGGSLVFIGGKEVGKKPCLTDSLLSSVWGGSGLWKAVLRGALLAEGLREAWPSDFFT